MDTEGVLPIVPDRCVFQWKRLSDNTQFRCAQPDGHPEEHRAIESGIVIVPKIGDTILISMDDARCKLTWRPSRGQNNEWVRCQEPQGHDGAHHSNHFTITGDPEFLKQWPHRWDGITEPPAWPARSKPWAGGQYEKTADYLDSVGISPLDIVTNSININGYERIRLDENARRLLDQDPDSPRGYLVDEIEWPSFEIALHAVDLFLQDGGWRENR